MAIRDILTVIIYMVLWTPVVFFSFLLTHNAILYFTHGGEYGILPEKIVARQDLLWNISFYIHLPSGILCLCAPLVLFIGRLFHLPRIWHKTIGKWYVWMTLLLVCPTGVYLALYTKGGLSTQLGFMVQAVLLAWFTYQGYKAIGRGDKQAHADAMIRSYSIATVVLSFRIFHILFFIWKVPYQDNYAMSQWLGVACNSLLAEICIYFKNYRIKNVNLKPLKL